MRNYVGNCGPEPADDAVLFNGDEHVGLGGRLPNRLFIERANRVHVDNPAGNIVRSEAICRIGVARPEDVARLRPDIAYHLLIDRKGNVYEGRPVLASGESTSRRHGYDATGHLLVMCDGNFETQAPSRKQLNALADVLAWASVRFDVSPATITGHRDHAPTACPGKRLYRFVKDGTLERAVQQRVNAGGVDLVLVEGKRAKMRVAAIEGR